MRLPLAFVFACACGAPAVPVAPVLGGDTRPAQASTSPAAIALSTAALPDAREAPPGGPIHSLAVTPDGRAAITIDDGGGVRLWPSLDGRIEPRVVRFNTNVPVDLAIEHAGSGFVVASIDEGHDLTITRIDADGRVLGHRGLGGNPAFVGVATFDGGVLAWSSDEKLVLFDTDGATRGAIGTQPGERLVSVATAGSHVVAEVEVPKDDARRRRVRAVAVAPALAWGDFVDGDHVAVGGPIAISPSGKRLAVISSQTPPTLDVIDTTNGKELVALSATPRELVFVDDDHLASVDGTVQWFEASGLVPKLTASTASQLVGTIAAARGDGQLVALDSGHIALATTRQVQYLGYAIVTPTVSASGSGGSLLVAAGSAATLLDPQLRGHGAIDVGAAPLSMAWLGGNDWFSVGGEVRIASTTAPPVLADTQPSTALLARYEPSTKLATTSFGDTASVYRWDPDKRTMTALASVARATPYRMLQLVPVAPERGGGTRMVRVTVRDEATIEWFSDDKMTVRTAKMAAAAVLAVDSAGHVYAWTHDTKAHVAILANGTEIGTLPLDGAGVVEPDETGSRVAVLTAKTVSLFVGGKRAWSRDVSLVRSVEWLSDGSLALITTAGIERLDPATGATTAQRCGWAFGLSKRPLPPISTVEPVCAR